MVMDSLKRSSGEDGEMCGDATERSQVVVKFAAWLCSWCCYCKSGCVIGRNGKCILCLLWYGVVWLIVLTGCFCESSFGALVAELMGFSFPDCRWWVWACCCCCHVVAVVVFVLFNVFVIVVLCADETKWEAAPLSREERLKIVCIRCSVKSGVSYVHWDHELERWSSMLKAIQGMNGQAVSVVAVVMVVCLMQCILLVVCATGVVSHG